MTARFLFLAAIACLALHINYPEGFTRPSVPPKPAPIRLAALPDAPGLREHFDKLSAAPQPPVENSRTVVFGKITKADAVRFMASVGPGLREPQAPGSLNQIPSQP